MVRRHGHNKAVIRVANKMLTIIWYMMKNKECYRERKDTLYQRKLKRMSTV